jgi:hypothetical protein
MREPLDDYGSAVASPDLQTSTAGAATAASITSKDSYTITIENLPVKLTGKYNFVFQYYYQNPDQTQSTPILGPVSATYSVAPTIADLSTAPTNVVATGGFYSYQLKWDTPAFVSYGDTIVYESDTNSFNSSSKVVYVGTANQCTILTSDLNPKYVYVVHRDMFLDANKKGTVAGPITIQDPISVDANPPSNNFSVGTTTVQDDPDGLFTFNKKILFSWTQNTDTSTYGYQIRFRRVGTTDYTYMSVPGRSTTSTYLYGVKAGQTYEIGVSTYDQFGNINVSDWKTYPNIVIPASTSLQADVAITAGDMKMGYGIGGDSANKGLYLGPENYWYIQGNTTASSSARLSIGGTSDKLLWNGTDLSITGNLTARAGTFTGNILMAGTNASIYNGTVNSSGNLTGNGFALNAGGLKVANGTNSVTIDAANGRIIANAGTIGGWSLTDSLLNQNNARLSSTGYIELGGANTDNIIRLDANDGTYRMWIGRNSSTTAPFRVTKEGKLYATDAVIQGTINVGTVLSDGTSLTDIRDNAANAVNSSTVNSRITTAFSTASNYSASAIIGQINAALGIGETSTSRINGSLMIDGTVKADVLGGTYILGKEIYQGYHPTFASTYTYGGVSLTSDATPGYPGRPGMKIYGPDHNVAGWVSSWLPGDHLLEIAANYTSCYIDMSSVDNVIDIKGTGGVNLSGALYADTIRRGRNSTNFTGQAGRTITITHSMGSSGYTFVVTPETDTYDFVVSVRSRTDSSVTVEAYHRTGATIGSSGSPVPVYFNWICLATSNSLY